MSRFADDRRAFFIEEPVFEEKSRYVRETVCEQSGVRVCTPVLPVDMPAEGLCDAQQQLLGHLIQQHAIENYCAWYYTPMALTYSQDLTPQLTVYDCMDELSAFAGACSAMRENERQLFRKADLVFTGGRSLYESKRGQHPSVHLFPSSVDFAHFKQARETKQEPQDQVEIPRPRLGYAGVIDERMDLTLLKTAAESRPDWHFVMIGPVVKIDPATLPRNQNIHYLGMKPYGDLPTYFSGWDIGMLPFALNESTRFISPTKTPEYLAAGLPVISTPIRDVMKPYGDLGLVRISDGPSEFVRVAHSLLDSPPNDEFERRVDKFLSQSSWDKTCSEMNRIMEDKLTLKRSQFAQHAVSIAASEGESHV